MTQSSLVPAVAAIIMSLALAAPVASQTCQGTPPRGGISADYSHVSFGSAFGATGTYAGNRTAFTLGARALDLGSRTSGFDGNGQFAVLFHVGRVSICPALALGFGQTTWKATAGEVKSTALTAAPGLSFGSQYTVWRDISVVPFVGMRYAFSAVKYDLSASGTDSQSIGDTLSGVYLNYGLVARYNMLYVGFHGDRLIAGAATNAKLVVGVTFPLKSEP